MPNTDTNMTSQQPEPAKPFLQTNKPLAIGAAILMVASGLLGYTVGHRQGLTVVGFDADAEQLVEVVQKQKTSLDALNKNYLSLQKALDQQAQSETTAVIYREVLRQRGGIPLAVQHIAIKPLPENAFEYQLDLVQVSPSKRAASGTVELRLIRGTEVLVVPLEDKNFNFENYERLTGRWTMPKGFTPQFIEVRLTGSTPVTRRFSWSRGEAVESQSAFVSEIPQTEANAQ